MNNEGRKAHLVGSGIANLAAAAYLIKDGGFSGANIAIYEEEHLPGGCLDSAGAPEQGYFMRGERMFEENYVCMYDLLSFIPSVDDPTKTIKQDTLEFTKAYRWNNKARLVDNGKIMNFRSYGFSAKDELELLALTSKPERARTISVSTTSSRSTSLQRISGTCGKHSLPLNHGTAPLKCAATC